MVLGLSKPFIIFFIISIGLGYGTRNWRTTVVLMIIYAIVIIIWRFLTR